MDSTWRNKRLCLKREGVIEINILEKDGMTFISTESEFVLVINGHIHGPFPKTEKTVDLIHDSLLSSK